MKKIVLSSVALIFSVLFVKSQIAIGEWRDHLPYMHATKVAHSGENIFCATEQSIFIYNKSGNTTKKLSRVEGLSDIGISAVNFSEKLNALVIAFKNGNIDIWRDNEIINLSDIKRKQIPGLKSINNILILDGNAYLACSFGIVVLNLSKYEVKDTYYIGFEGARINVFDMIFDGNYLYAATEQGILRGRYDDPGLFYYENWENINSPANGTVYNMLVGFGDKIIANQADNTNITDSVFIINESSREFVNSIPGIKNYSFWADNDQFIIASNEIVRVLDNELNQVREIDTYSYGLPSTRDAIADPDGVIWIADNNSGLVRVNEQGHCDGIFPNGPYTTGTYNLTSDNRVVCSVGGGIDAARNALYKRSDLFIFRDGTWKSKLEYSAHDAVNVLIDPRNSNKIYAGTWGNGVLVYENGEKTGQYSDSNSTLQSIIPGDDFVRISGMDFDHGNNLWITNEGVDNPVSVLTENGEWFSFPYMDYINSPHVGEILVSENGHKWIILPKGNGLFVFDEYGTFGDINDDEWRKFSVTDNDGESFNNVFSINEDLDGNIWVGTDHGPLVYYAHSNIFSDNSITAQRIKIPRNDGSGLADYMLGTETITSIAVDGANRKWMGTENAGVFLLSEDGTEQIYSFNSSNSPLFSNRINSLTIDQESGEVFFGTDKGLISYRSTSTAGKNNFNSIYVFPNPVRENYHGPITISNLVKNVNVKITDISGNLVYETTALGGQALWDGKNSSGKRVQTGVYLVFCSSKDGSKTHVTKLLFIH